MATVSKPLPRLEPGDRLSREEFHRRYEARPDIKRAELVGGIVYVPSPLSLGKHGEPHGPLVMWLQFYAGRTPGVRFGDNATVFLAEDGEVQPDALLFWEPPRGTQAWVNDDDYVESAPELIAEVAASSAHFDLHEKKKAYRRAGVQEYIVRRTLDRVIDWFRLVEGQYVAVELDARGIIESRAFPGLRLDPAAMISGQSNATFTPLGNRPG